MTTAEKTKYAGFFPKLDVDKAVVSGEATPKGNPPMPVPYNCLAWTLGYTDRWVWPGETEADFDRLYGAAGFVRAANGIIAAWGHSASKMTHGSITGPGHGPRWESKCGYGLRIQHGLTELSTALTVGAEYGDPRYFYKRRTGRMMGIFAAILERLRMKSVVPPHSARDREAVAFAVDQLPGDVRDEFERRYTRWREEWTSPRIQLSSDPGAVTSVPGFDELLEMGPGILPLVMEKLMQPGEFLALQLYDRLHERPLLVTEMPAHLLVGGEQLRARNAVQTWLAERRGSARSEM